MALSTTERAVWLSSGDGLRTCFFALGRFGMALVSHDHGTNGRAKLQRLERDAPLPEQMQGRWTDVDDPNSELVIRGGEVICFGQPVKYDYKLVGSEDGALTVSLKINNEADEDTFQRANITELVITPEGTFHAYNVKFSSEFERAD